MNTDAAPCLLKADPAKHVQDAGMSEAACPSRVVATGQETRQPSQLGPAARLAELASLA